MWARIWATQLCDFPSCFVNINDVARTDLDTVISRVAIREIEQDKY